MYVKHALQIARCRDLVQQLKVSCSSSGSPDTEDPQGSPPNGRVELNHNLAPSAARSGWNNGITMAACISHQPLGHNHSTGRSRKQEQVAGR